jgi:predicted transcriptional regulator of viral defense system
VKVRNGLYVSNTGRFTGLKADPYRIAAAFDATAVFSFHSALKLHGLAHSLSNRVQFRSTNPRLSFKFDGSTFERYLSQNDVPTDTVRADSYGVVKVTTREQTFLDCMNRMRLCGGAEEVLHSLAGLPYLNLTTVEELLLAHPASVSARAGWYLEANEQRWNVSEALLDRLEERLPANASYHLDSSARKGAQAFSARWKLNLPAPLDEIESWMEL